MALKHICRQRKTDFVYPRLSRVLYLFTRIIPWKIEDALFVLHRIGNEVGTINPEPGIIFEFIFVFVSVVIFN